MTLSENYLMENAENSVSEAFKFQNGLGVFLQKIHKTGLHNRRSFHSLLRARYYQLVTSYENVQN